MLLTHLSFQQQCLNFYHFLMWILYSVLYTYVFRCDKVVYENIYLSEWQIYKYYGRDDFSSIQFSHSVMSDSLWPHGLQHTRPPCPSPTPRAYSNSHPSSRWCHPTISSSVVPFTSRLWSFPASGSFLRSQLISSGGQNIGVSASASILPINTQDWSPLGWTGRIYLQSKGLSRVFSNTRFESINSSALSFLYSPTLTSIHDYWKNNSFDYMNLCWQSNVSAF